MIIDLEQAPKQDNGSPIMIGRRTGFLTMKRIGRDRMRNASEIYIKVPDSIYAISSPFLMGLLNDALTVNPELADYVTITPGFQATLSDAIRSIRMQLYILSIQAFDETSALQGKTKPLWHTKVSCPARGLNIIPTLKEMV